MVQTLSERCRDHHCQLVTAWIGIDFAQQGVWRGTRFIPLAARTFAILAYLARHSGTVSPTDQLLAVGWPDDLTRHIHRIRQAIEVHPTRPRILVNRRGPGTVFGILLRVSEDVQVLGKCRISVGLLSPECRFRAIR